MIDAEELGEFKAICRDLGHELSDEEAQDAAQRVIRFLMAVEPARNPRLSVEEQTAFEMIRVGPPPSIREITKKLGLSSSRSGYRVVVSLIQKGLVRRDERGLLSIVERRGSV